MKPNTFLLITTVGLLYVTSCSNFLDRDPLDQPSSGTFWKTTDDFKVALTACYGILQRDIYSTYAPNWDNITDNGYGQHSYAGSTNVVTGNINANSSGFISDVFINAFKDIARINNFIKQLNDFSGLDASAKEKYEAEVRMLRAYIYSYLYRCYGDAPLIVKPLDLETQNQPKAKAEELLKFILAEYDFAIKNLPDKTYAKNKGRWTKNAAVGMKARMLLYTAYTDGGEAKLDVMQEIKTLLSGITGYTLAPEYTDNFQDAGQENCPEIMMSVKFLAPNNATSVDLWFGDWIVVSPLVNLISEYEMLDGSPGVPVPYTGKGVIDPKVYTNADLARRDSRLAKTVFIDKYVIKGVLYTPSNARPLGTGLQKFLSQNIQPPYGYATLSQQDWVLLRYADVLLMRAEVENEINPAPTSVVYDAINQIRKRSDMPDLPVGLSKTEMRSRIRHERRIELAFEGHRYFDLKRWKIAKQVLSNIQDGLVNYKFEDRFYLWPIPQSEIDKSNGILEQNPTYL